MAYLDFGVSPLERLLGDFLGVWNLKGVSGRMVIEKVIFVDFIRFFGKAQASTVFRMHP